MARRSLCGFALTSASLFFFVFLFADNLDTCRAVGEDASLVLNSTSDSTMNSSEDISSFMDKVAFKSAQLSLEPITAGSGRGVKTHMTVTFEEEEPEDEDAEDGKDEDKDDRVQSVQVSNGLDSTKFGLKVLPKKDKIKSATPKNPSSHSRGQVIPSNYGSKSPSKSTSKGSNAPDKPSKLKTVRKKAVHKPHYSPKSSTSHGSQSYPDHSSPSGHSGPGHYEPGHSEPSNSRPGHSRLSDYGPGKYHDYGRPDYEQRGPYSSPPEREPPPPQYTRDPPPPASHYHHRPQPLPAGPYYQYHPRVRKTHYRPYRPRYAIEAPQRKRGFGSHGIGELLIVLAPMAVIPLIGSAALTSWTTSFVATNMGGGAKTRRKRDIVTRELFEWRQDVHGGSSAGSGRFEVLGEDVTVAGNGTSGGGDEDIKAAKAPSRRAARLRSRDPGQIEPFKVTSRGNVSLNEKPRSRGEGIERFWAALDFGSSLNGSNERAGSRVPQPWSQPEPESPVASEMTSGLELSGGAIDGRTKEGSKNGSKEHEGPVKGRTRERTVQLGDQSVSTLLQVLDKKNIRDDSLDRVVGVRRAISSSSHSNSSNGSNGSAGPSELFSLAKSPASLEFELTYPDNYGMYTTTVRADMELDMRSASSSRTKNTMIRVDSSKTTTTTTTEKPDKLSPRPLPRPEKSSRTVFDEGQWRPLQDAYLVDISRSKGRKEMSELDIIQRYLSETRPNGDYNDEIIATYLSCNGMLAADNHCMERLACHFVDTDSSMKELEKDVSSLIIYALLKNQFIEASFKARLRKAAEFARTFRGRCNLFSCDKGSKVKMRKVS